MRLLQQLWQLGSLGLQVRVPANVVLADEDIWHGALLGHALERILDGCTII